MVAYWPKLRVIRGGLISGILSCQLSPPTFSNRTWQVFQLSGPDDIEQYLAQQADVPGEGSTWGRCPAISNHCSLTFPCDIFWKILFVCICAIVSAILFWVPFCARVLGNSRLSRIDMSCRFVFVSRLCDLHISLRLLSWMDVNRVPASASNETKCEERMCLQRDVPYKQRFLAEGWKCVVRRILECGPGIWAD